MTHEPETIDTFLTLRAKSLLYFYYFTGLIYPAHFYNLRFARAKIKERARHWVYTRAIAAEQIAVAIEQAIATYINQIGDEYRTYITNASGITTAIVIDHFLVS
ncbi:hypothetical protein GCM10028805_30280 [Spirosoma harenae]